MTAFPWGQAMRFGLGVLRLAPRDFWAMTPRELAMAHEALAGTQGGALGRGTLDGLMARFPDLEAGDGRAV